MVDIANIDELIKAYDATKEKYQQARIDGHIPPITALLGEFGAVRRCYYEWNREHAERYNIFDILNIRFRETKTHTPFLVNLLNPRGTHGQGVAFFNLFMDKVAPENIDQLCSGLESSNIRVREEKRTRDGQLDIIIESVGTEKRFIIVIENKIYATDQKLQLTRYYNYCKTMGYTDKNILLIYLTRNGKDVTKYSMAEDERERLKADRVLVNMSYREHISEVLELYIANLKSEKVKVVIQQYLNIIKTF